MCSCGCLELANAAGCCQFVIVHSRGLSYCWIAGDTVLFIVVKIKANKEFHSIKKPRELQGKFNVGVCKRMQMENN